MSALITTVIKQTIRDGRIVLEPSLKPTTYLENIIDQAEEDLKAGLATKPMDKSEVREHLLSLIKND